MEALEKTQTTERMTKSQFIDVLKEAAENTLITKYFNFSDESVKFTPTLDSKTDKVLLCNNTVSVWQPYNGSGTVWNYKYSNLDEFVGYFTDRGEVEEFFLAYCEFSRRLTEISGITFQDNRVDEEEILLKKLKIFTAIKEKYPTSVFNIARSKIHIEEFDGCVINLLVDSRSKAKKVEVTSSDIGIRMSGSFLGYEKEIDTGELLSKLEKKMLNSIFLNENGNAKQDFIFDILRTKYFHKVAQKYSGSEKGRKIEEEFNIALLGKGVNFKDLYQFYCILHRENIYETYFKSGKLFYYYDWHNEKAVCSYNETEILNRLKKIEKSNRGV